jgi:carbonic anhydrase
MESSNMNKRIKSFLIFSMILLITHISYSKVVQTTEHINAADSGVVASTAFQWLKNGNTRYIRGMLRNDGQSKEDRQRLVTGQKPHTIVLSCSDSRVPPEVLFDQKLGEIFVVRTAGEALDNAVIASIEYAIEHLGVHLLVVMAHESCGAVKAAFSTLSGGDAGSPSLNALVYNIHPHIRKFLGQQPSDKFLSESKANAVGVASDLVARSKIVSEKIKGNELQIETAIYHLASGSVEFYSAPQSRRLASEESK